MTLAYPLQWPPHIQRTNHFDQKWGAFQVSPSTAIIDLLNEIERSGGINPVISTNMGARKNGLPYISGIQPDDCGVAVYFTRKGQQICIPCDTYDKVWKNIRAIGLSIKDMRGPEKRGCAEITNQAFSGFTALPPPDQMSVITTPVAKQWWEILNVNQDTPIAVCETAWKALVRNNGGGSVELNAAIEQARNAK